MPYQMTAKDRQALADIIAQYYHEAEADYCDTVPDDTHIYYAFRHLQRWLEANATTPNPED